MLQEDYKETREGTHSCLETTTTKISDENTELILLSSFFLTAEQPEHKAQTHPRRQYAILSKK